MERINITPPLYQFNGHIQTIYPSLYRKIEVPYKRERIDLPDGDFVDLDWVKNGSKKLILVTHGLEGDSSRHYVTGLIKLFAQNGFDGLGWNCRSCSGEPNRLPRFYHHGDAEDLRYVLEYAIFLGYEEVFVAGYSMGGSLTLRLLGEFPQRLPKEVSGAMVASVPLDLYSSVRELQKNGKQFYMKRFIKKLAVKIEEKSRRFPEHPHLNFENYFEKIKNFEDFDGTYTAPLHGYESALDFYEKASAKPLLKNVLVPTTIIQAANDPFLGEECYDRPDNVPDFVKLLITDKGGHVGFMERGQEFSFTERLALEMALN
ncbi:YheT family hydrolase [Jiulongibacter sp. NS-SX5]|uniref:YheT family hydrolase n=1 Tax=Jiulongibacter sp. NS-SX5 TaxID=3463854 RepID=UPI00405959FD